MALPSWGQVAIPHKCDPVRAVRARFVRRLRIGTGANLTLDHLFCARDGLEYRITPSHQITAKFAS